MASVKKNIPLDFIKNNTIAIHLTTVSSAAIINLYVQGVAFLILTAILFLYSVSIFIFFDVINSKRKKNKYIAPVAICIVVAIILLFLYFTVLRSNIILNLMDRIFKTVNEPDNTDLVLIILLPLGFFSSGVNYYFTRIRYRCFFIFLAQIIPFALYGKTFTEVPAIFSVMIIILFILTTVHCRNFNESSTEKIVVGRSYYATVIFFVCGMSIAAAFLPKLDHTPMREEFDEFVISVSGNTNHGFYTNDSNSASVNRGNNKISDTLLYTVYTDNPVYIRNRVYEPFPDDTYNAEYDDSLYYWTYWAENLDSEKLILGLKDLWGKMQENENYSDYTKSDFAFLDEIEATKSVTGSMTIAAENENYTKYLLSTSQPIDYSFSNGDIDAKDVLRTSQDEYYAYGIAPNDCKNYTVDYKIYKPNIEFLNMPNLDEFLWQAKYYTEEINSKAKLEDQDYVLYSDTIYAFYEKSKDAYFYNQNQCLPPDISDELKALASEITSGLESDYEKAKAIEAYFHSGEFTYDLEFVPEELTSEYFIFESKKGICSDFAKAMVLIARESGLSARYTEGFKLGKEAKQGIYRVTNKDSHAFPEIYIDGYGWTIFEPTVGSDSLPQNALQQTPYLTFVIYGFSAFLLMALCVIFIISLPKLKEALFVARINRLSPKEQVVTVFNRIYKLTSEELPENNILTTQQLSKTVKSKYNLDISELQGEFDRVVYGGKPSESRKLSKLYSLFKKARKSAKRNKKINNK